MVWKLNLRHVASWGVTLLASTGFLKLYVPPG